MASIGCEWDIDQPVMCPMDVWTCTDGTILQRDPRTCEFPECPSTSQYNCFTRDLVSNWTRGKRSYCCSNYGIGCRETAGYNCYTRDLVSNWTRGKRGYCCANYGIGCREQGPVITGRRLVGVELEKAMNLDQE